MKCRVIAATFAAITLLPGSSAAQSISGYAQVDRDGNPSVVVSSAGLAPAEHEAIRWRACPPDGGACVPLSGAGAVEPGPTAPGTVFEAHLARAGAELTARTPAWSGQIQSAGVPALNGEPKVGARVHVVPTSWTGGWAAAPFTEGAPRSGYAIAACSDETGTQCFLIAEQQVALDGIQLEPRWVGWRLLVGEWRQAGGNPVPAIGWAPPVPMTLERLQGGQPAPYGTATGTRARLSAMSAPVAGNPGAAAPADPTVKLRARALRAKGRMTVGRMTCALSCKVAVKVSGGGRKARTTTFLARSGSTAITVPARRGKLTVRVRVDGKLLANGKVKA
jgi:hypothetical protein